MNFIKYLKERYLFISSSILIVLFQWGLLVSLKTSKYAIFLISTLYLLCNLSYLFFEYERKSKFLSELRNQCDALNEKYLLSEMVDEPNEVEDKEFYEILKECNKSMNDNISMVSIENKEYRDYIELWVHEIKSPIASSKLIIENNSSKITESLGEEIEKIEEYIEQALYYTRSNGVEKDYIIKRLNLEKEVNSAVRRSSKSLIEKKVKIVKEDLDFVIFSDSKWISFILHQIITNSIKYFDKTNNELTFIGKEIGQDIVLDIIDNGIGMDSKTLLKAFDKGYTGENGRMFKESTGIGLYLCKKLCAKLGLGIKIESKPLEYTKVSILFPKNKMLLLEENMIEDICNKKQLNTSKC